MHKKILGVVIVAALVALALGAIILKKDQAPAAKNMVIAERVVPPPPVTMTPPSAAPGVPLSPAPTNMVPPSPTAMPPQGSAGLPTLPPIIVPPVTTAPGLPASVAPTSGQLKGAVSPLPPGTVVPPPNDLIGLEMMPHDLKIQRVTEFLKLDKDQKPLLQDYFIALNRVDDQERATSRPPMSGMMQGGMPPMQTMAPPPVGVSMQGGMPPVFMRPLAGRITDTEALLKNLKDVDVLREKFLKSLSKDQLKKVQPYLDRGLI